MLHKNASPLAGKTVKIKEDANDIGGQEFVVEDYWDRVSGQSWMFANGNPACIMYAMRTGFSTKINIPTDNQVLYGKIGYHGYLVHETEIAGEVKEDFFD